MGSGGEERGLEAGVPFVAPGKFGERAKQVHPLCVCRLDGSLVSLLRRAFVLFCKFLKIGALEIKEYRAWEWKVPNLATVWGAIAQADLQSTPEPWAKPTR